MNRLISIGFAIAVAPAILLEIGRWIESPDTISLSAAVLGRVALPLGGLLVFVGLCKAAVNKTRHSQLPIAQKVTTRVERIIQGTKEALLSGEFWPGASNHRIDEDRPARFTRVLMSLGELPVAFGVAWLTLYQFYEAVKRFSGQELSIAGVAVSAVGLGGGMVVAAVFYWKMIAIRDLRIWIFVNIMVILAIWTWLVGPMRQKETLRQKEVAALHQVDADDAKRYAAWVEQLRLSVNHGPPGIIPPMLKVEDNGTTLQVQNMAEKTVTLVLRRVRQDPAAPDRWKSCGTYTDRDHGVSLKPGEIRTYRFYDTCAEQFKNAPIEYRVGGWRAPYTSNAADIGWWSDSALSEMSKPNH